MQTSHRVCQIVVALIDGENATLKHIQFPKKEWVRLIPANKTMQPKNYASDRVTIQGILVGQVRMYLYTMQNWNRAIILVDMDAFFASIEQHDRTELHKKLIGITNGQAGTYIINCSYEARQYGIKTSMRL
jgi:hypothetical protein